MSCWSGWINVRKISKTLDRERYERHGILYETYWSDPYSIQGKTSNTYHIPEFDLHTVDKIGWYATRAHK